MERGAIDLMVFRALGHEAVVTLRIVILVEFIQLDNLNQFIGILRIGGIASSLQTFGPSPYSRWFSD